MQVADLFIRFVGDDSQIKRQLQGTEGAAATAGEKGGGAFGKKFATAAKAAFVGAGAIAGALFTTAITKATEFQDQMAIINTVVKGPPEQIKAIGDSILELSKVTGATSDDLTAGFYDLVSAGVSADDAIGVLSDSAKFAKGSLGTTAEAVDLVTSALNAYGLDASHSAEVTDIFAKAVQDGKVTASELGQSIANIAPVAASAGISLEEVSAGYAALTAKGVPAAQAATEMRAAISALLTPNETLNKLQNQTGKNYAKLADTKGLAVALEEMRQDFADNGDALAKLAGVSEKDFPKALKASAAALGLTNSQIEHFTAVAGKDGAAAAIQEIAKETGKSEEGFAKALGSIEGYQFALITTGDNADEFAGQIKETGESAGLAGEQYDIMADTAKSSGQRIAATINAAMIQIAGPFVDSFGPALEAINSLGPAFGMIMTQGLGAITGGAISYILIPALTAAAGIVGPVVTSLFTAIGALIPTAIGIGVALLPVILVAALVAAVIFLANNPQIVDQIVQFGRDMIQWLVDTLSALPGQIGPIVGQVWEMFLAALPGFIDAVTGFILSIPDKIASLVPKVLDLFFKLGSLVLELIGHLIPMIVNIFLGLPGAIAKFGPMIFDQFARLVGIVLPKMIGFIGELIGFFLSIPFKIAGLIPGIVGQFLKVAAQVIPNVAKFIGDIIGWFMGIPGRIAALGPNIVKTIVGGLASLPGKIADIIRSAFSKLHIKIGPFTITGSGISIDLPKIDVPHFASGSMFVPATMLAVVHKGEMIIPANDAAAIRAGRGLTAQPTPAQGQGTAPVYQVNVQGLVQARDPLEIARQLQRFGEMRLLPGSF